MKIKQKKELSNKKKNKITVILGDDHPLLRAGFTTALTDDSLIDVIKESDNANDVCDAYEKLKPDVVVLDILFKEKMTGIDALKKILSKDKNAAIIILTQHDQTRLIKEAYEQGAKSFVPKDVEPELLIEAIKHAAKGEVYFLPEIAQKLAALTTQYAEESPKKILTEREFMVYKLTAKDKTTSEVAVELSISPRTVANDLQIIRGKLGVTRKTEITKHAIKHGVIQIE